MNESITPMRSFSFFEEKLRFSFSTKLIAKNRRIERKSYKFKDERANSIHRHCSCESELNYQGYMQKLESGVACPFIKSFIMHYSKC